MITIKKNPYVQPNDVREEVVQAICDAFLGVGGDASNPSRTHDFCTQGMNDELPTIYVAKNNVRADYSCFRNERQKKETERCSRDGEYTFYRIRGVEMRAAFEELQKAGYFMFGLHMTTGDSHYRCFCKPHMEGWSRISEFKRFID